MASAELQKVTSRNASQTPSRLEDPSDPFSSFTADRAPSDRHDLHRQCQNGTAETFNKAVADQLQQETRPVEIRSLGSDPTQGAGPATGVLPRLRPQDNPYRNPTKEERDQNNERDRLIPHDREEIFARENGPKVIDPAVAAAVKQQAGGDPTRYKELLEAAFFAAMIGQGADLQDMQQLAKQRGLTHLTKEDLAFALKNSDPIFYGTNWTPYTPGVAEARHPSVAGAISRLEMQFSFGKDLETVKGAGLLKTTHDGWQRIEDCYPRTSEDYAAASVLLGSNAIQHEFDDKGRPIITDPAVPEEVRRRWNEAMGVK